MLMPTNLKDDEGDEELEKLLKTLQSVRQSYENSGSHCRGHYEEEEDSEQIDGETPSLSHGTGRLATPSIGDQRTSLAFLHRRIAKKYTLFRQFVEAITHHEASVDLVKEQLKQDKFLSSKHLLTTHHISSSSVKREETTLSSKTHENGHISRSAASPSKKKRQQTRKSSSSSSSSSSPSSTSSSSSSSSESSSCSRPSTPSSLQQGRPGCRAEKGEEKDDKRLPSRHHHHRNVMLLAAGLHDLAQIHTFLGDFETAGQHFQEAAHVVATSPDAEARVKQYFHDVLNKFQKRKMKYLERKKKISTSHSVGDEKPHSSPNRRCQGKEERTDEEHEDHSKGKKRSDQRPSSLLTCSSSSSLSHRDSQNEKRSCLPSPKAKNSQEKDHETNLSKQLSSSASSPVRRSQLSPVSAGREERRNGLDLKKNQRVVLSSSHLSKPSSSSTSFDPSSSPSLRENEEGAGGRIRKTSSSSPFATSSSSSCSPRSSSLSERASSSTCTATSTTPSLSTSHASLSQRSSSSSSASSLSLRTVPCTPRSIVLERRKNLRSLPLKTERIERGEKEKEDNPNEELSSSSSSSSSCFLPRPPGEREDIKEAAGTSLALSFKRLTSAARRASGRKEPPLVEKRTYNSTGGIEKKGLPTYSGGEGDRLNYSQADLLHHLPKNPTRPSCFIASASAFERGRDPCLSSRPGEKEQEEKEEREEKIDERRRCSLERHQQQFNAHHHESLSEDFLSSTNMSNDKKEKKLKDDKEEEDQTDNTKKNNLHSLSLSSSATTPSTSSTSSLSPSSSSSAAFLTPNPHMLRKTDSTKNRLKKRSAPSQYRFFTPRTRETWRSVIYATDLLNRRNEHQGILTAARRRRRQMRKEEEKEEAQEQEKEQEDEKEGRKNQSGEPAELAVSPSTGHHPHPIRKDSKEKEKEISLPFNPSYYFSSSSSSTCARSFSLSSSFEKDSSTDKKHNTNQEKQLRATISFSSFHVSSQKEEKIEEEKEKRSAGALFAKREKEEEDNNKKKKKNKSTSLKTPIGTDTTSPPCRGGQDERRSTRFDNSSSSDLGEDEEEEEEEESTSSLSPSPRRLLIRDYHYPSSTQNRSFSSSMSSMMNNHPSLTSKTIEKSQLLEPSEISPHLSRSSPMIPLPGEMTERTKTCNTTSGPLMDPSLYPSFLHKKQMNGLHLSQEKLPLSLPRPLCHFYGVTSILHWERDFLGHSNSLSKETSSHRYNSSSSSSSFSDSFYRLASSTPSLSSSSLSSCSSSGVWSSRGLAKKENEREDAMKRKDSQGGILRSVDRLTCSCRVSFFSNETWQLAVHPISTSLSFLENKKDKKTKTTSENPDETDREKQKQEEDEENASSSLSRRKSRKEEEEGGCTSQYHNEKFFHKERHLLSPRDSLSPQRHSNKEEEKGEKKQIERKKNRLAHITEREEKKHLSSSSSSRSSLSFLPAELYLEGTLDELYETFECGYSRYPLSSSRKRETDEDSEKTEDEELGEEAANISRNRREEEQEEERRKNKTTACTIRREANLTERERDERTEDGEEEKKKNARRSLTICELREKANCILQHVLIDYQQQPVESPSASIQHLLPASHNNPTSWSVSSTCHPEKQSVNERDQTSSHQSHQHEKTRKETGDSAYIGDKEDEAHSRLFDKNEEHKTTKQNETRSYKDNASRVWRPILKINRDLLQFDRASIKLTLVLGAPRLQSQSLHLLHSLSSFLPSP